MNVVQMCQFGLLDFIWFVGCRNSVDKGVKFVFVRLHVMMNVKTDSRFLLGIRKP